MKKALFIVTLLSLLNGYSQKLPTLNLKKLVEKKLHLPVNIDKGDICIILEKTHGWSSYDFSNFYYFKDNGNVFSYSKQKPKNYLRDHKKLKTITKKVNLNQEQKNQLLKNLFSELTTNFLRYSQKDFFYKKQKKTSSCFVTDSPRYNLTFIQNQKMSSYSYYAPFFFYKKCGDKNINKKVLKDYISLISLWNLQN